MTKCDGSKFQFVENKEKLEKKMKSMDFHFRTYGIYSHISCSILISFVLFIGSLQDVRRKAPRGDRLHLLADRRDHLHDRHPDDLQGDQRHPR